MSTSTQQLVIRSGRAIVRQIEQWFADSEQSLDDASREQFGSAVQNEVFQAELRRGAPEVSSATAAELAREAIDKIEALAAALAALGKEDLLPGEQARAMCARLDDVVTGLLHCPADDTCEFDPCAACDRIPVCE